MHLITELPPPTQLETNAVTAGQSVGQQLTASEWLGPLSPIALSPFFGLATLSGIATYGPPWLQQRSALFQTGGSLDNPWLFWVMASLALFTSLPRFTKVSKPLSLAAEKLEAYSAIVILISIRMFGGSDQIDSAGVDPQAAQLMLSAGIGSFSLNLVMSLLAALNVFVVNMVKLLVEFLVWLIPIPAVDAMLELANKSICASLMALYCYNPWLASLLNLVILSLSLVVFLWVYRRVNYYKELIAGPLLAWLIPRWFGQQGSSFQAFIERSSGSFPKYLPVKVTVSKELSQEQYQVSGTKWITNRFHLVLKAASSQPQSQNGLLCQRLELSDDAGGTYIISFRRWVPSDSLYSAQERSKNPSIATE